MVSCNSVASQRIFEVWQIALVVIGVVSYLVGSSVCSMLGVVLVLRATTKIGKLVVLCLRTEQHKQLLSTFLSLQVV